MNKKMSHRVDLKILGYESDTIATKSELTKLKQDYEEKGYDCVIVPYTDDTWELYVKKK